MVWKEIKLLNFWYNTIILSCSKVTFKSVWSQSSSQKVVLKRIFGICLLHLYFPSTQYNLIMYNVRILGGFALGPNPGNLQGGIGNGTQDL